jgi:formamidopyrimidine-DNA glycosylase
MPELAEVEWFRRKWNCGLHQRINRVAIHEHVRNFRFGDPALIKSLTGSRLQCSEARGKLMLFRFSGNKWLGIHLGMTGHLRVEKVDFKPPKHDHLVLFQSKRALVFTDPRQFGAVRFHDGKEPPPWWQALAPSVLSPDFTAKSVKAFLARHPRLPIKGTLLLQSGFPGVGNWMADEILWQARIHPKTLTKKLDDKAARNLWRHTRNICRKAIHAIVEQESEPLASWLFHQRWSRKGHCPRHRTPLSRATIAGRTTVWCSKCQGR